MIVAISDPAMLSRSFGVHRAMDTFGAFVGPLLAFWVLYLVPGDFHAVFVIAALSPRSASRSCSSRCPTFVCDVPGPAATRPTGGSRPDYCATRVCCGSRPRPGSSACSASARPNVFLELQDRDDLALTYYPLLVVGMNLGYLILAVPVGCLADRIGRWPVFVRAYIALILAYVAAGGPIQGAVINCVAVALLGAFYAATDGTLVAMAGQAIGESVRTSAIVTAQTVSAGAAFFAPLIFATLWTAVGRAEALPLVAAALPVVLPSATALMRGTGARPVPGTGRRAAP